LTHYQQQHPNDPQGENKIESQRQAAILDAEEKYGPQALASLIAEADGIRKELLKHIPTEEWTQFDRDEIRNFAEAIKNPTDLNLNKPQMGDYLENLRQRVK
jgi:hypothetical protein